MDLSLGSVDLSLDFTGLLWAQTQKIVFIKRVNAVVSEPKRNPLFQILTGWITLHQLGFSLDV